MFRYLADAANIRLCATGARLPVAMEADYRRLERAYLKAQPAERRGQPLLVNLEGLITNRPSAEPGLPPQRTLVVERFVGVHPGRGCPQPNPSANASAARTAATG
jgi:copper homeostasis protein (lipoprotein)